MPIPATDMTELHEAESDDAYERFFDRLAEVAKQHGIAHSRWSLWTVGTDPTPDPGDTLMSAHRYTGAMWLGYETNPFWDDNARCYTAQIRGPRRVDLWLAVDQILGRCGDKHHVFIERFLAHTSAPTRLTLECGS